MRPDFLVIGAQKCATSSLCGVLAAHPQVFMTDPKEPFFFSHDEIWAKGWSWYESLFADAGDARVLGEGSTTYTQHGLYPHAADRIAEHLPDARLIYIVRDPLERIRSHWMHLRSRSERETRPFNEAVRTRAEYIDNSLYHRQLGLYRARFPDDRILVLFFDDWVGDRGAVRRRCCEFLGVDPDLEGGPRDEKRHASSAGRVDRPIGTTLRRAPLYERLRDASPRPLREALRKVLKKPIGDRPEWDDATRAWAVEQLRDDTHAFLEAQGRPADLWGF